MLYAECRINMSGQLHSPNVLLLGKREGWLPNQSGDCGKEKESLPVKCIEPWLSSPQPVTEFSYTHAQMHFTISDSLLDTYPSQAQ